MDTEEIIELAKQAGFFINDELTITSPFIEDIEKMLVHMKKTKQKTEAYLAKTLEPIKEKKT